MPSATIANTGPDRQTVPRFGISEFLIQLPGVVPVSDLAVGPSKGRISLQAHGGDSVAIEGIGDADLVEQRAELARFIPAHGDAPHESESHRIDGGRADGPG